MTNVNPSIALLRARFLSGMARRIDEINRAIDLVATLPIDAAAEEELARMFHSIAGIGGTYGYPEITLLAKAGESACARDTRRDDSARVKLLRGIASAIETAAGVNVSSAAEAA